MSRRFFLVGIMVTIQPGSVTQLVIGTLFCTLYLSIQMQVGPYEHIDNDLCANSCSLALVIIFVRRPSTLSTGCG